MKNCLLKWVFVAVALLVAGCASMPNKDGAVPIKGEKTVFPKGWVCYAKGTITSVYKTQSGENSVMTFEVKTELGEAYSVDQKCLFGIDTTADTLNSYPGYSPASIGKKVILFVEEGKAVGMYSDTRYRCPNVFESPEKAQEKVAKKSEAIMAVFGGD